MNKQHKKLSDKHCLFCHLEDYDLLDVHRILPGSKGGVYNEHNTITVCSHCHRKIHADRIITYRKYFTSAGKYVLHCEIDGEEKWIES